MQVKPTLTSIRHLLQVLVLGALLAACKVQGSNFADLVCSSFAKDQQACSASLASLSSPFQPARSTSRSLLATAGPNAFLSLAYTFWCTASPSRCDAKVPLTHNYTTDASSLPSTISIPIPVNGTFTTVSAYPASGLLTPHLGQRSSGDLCTPAASDCYLEAHLPVQQSGFRLRATYVCFMVNTTASSAPLLGYPNGTGPVITVASRPVNNAITCRSNVLGPIFVAFYYPLDSATTLDRYQTVENDVAGQKCLTLNLQFRVQLDALSQSEQDEFWLNIRKSAALQLGYLDNKTTSSSDSGVNSTRPLLVGHVKVVSVSGSSVKTLLYAPANTSDWSMFHFWRRMQASDCHDLFGNAFAEKYGDNMFVGAGMKDKKSQWRSKVLWACVALGAVLLTAGGVVWLWRSLYKQSKAGAAAT